VKRLLPLALVLLAGSGCDSTRTPAPPADPQGPRPPLAIQPLSAHGAAKERPSGVSPGGVAGTVDLDPRVLSRATPGAVLFLIARNAENHEILAVRKEAGVRFPFAFHVSGADAMVEGTSFTGTIDLTARLSKSGEAMPGPGDVEGVLRGIASTAQGLTLTLDSVRD
jgi:cytochrome c-type biogenesis protein CcmH